MQFCRWSNLIQSLHCPPVHIRGPRQIGPLENVVRQIGGYMCAGLGMCIFKNIHLYWINILHNWGRYGKRQIGQSKNEA